MKTKIIVFSIITIMITSPIWVCFLPGLHNAKSMWVDYVIHQEVSFEDYIETPAPVVLTYVWHNGDIVIHWADHIDSDSTAIVAKKRAIEWRKMMMAND